MADQRTHFAPYHRAWPPAPARVRPGGGGVRPRERAGARRPLRARRYPRLTRRRWRSLSPAAAAAAAAGNDKYPKHLTTDFRKVRGPRVRVTPPLAPAPPPRPPRRALSPPAPRALGAPPARPARARAQMKPTMLRKYVDAFEMTVRPDAGPADLCAAVARHFEGHLDVEEEDVLARFVNSVRRARAPHARARARVQRGSEGGRAARAREGRREGAPGEGGPRTTPPPFPWPQP